MITYITLQRTADGSITPETNILNSQQQFIVNTVNCGGVMGKGLALAVKQRYPEVYADYHWYCQQGLLKPGALRACKANDGKVIINAATKDAWRNPSKLEWIEAILLRLRQRIREGIITSLALPPLGCGNGRLGWDEVGPLTAQYLGDLSIPIECYIEASMHPYHHR